MSVASEQGTLEAALRRHFGLQHFRPLQREIIETILAGHSAFAVLPTGGGKSLCYQLPALLLPGTALVISPLIALMKDQVDGLVQRGVKAVAINSHDTAAEGRLKLEALAGGTVKLAFVAPERLRNWDFVQACRQTRISLLAVDEAHCVSQWGHDFRPDYRFIYDFHQGVAAPPLLALTATARREVRDDVLAQLGIKGCATFAGSADRCNLWFGLEACATVAERRAKAAWLAANSGGSTIVYVGSRKEAAALAGRLEKGLGEPVACYHAGLPAAERTAVHNRFMANLCRVVVATNAFGMGIDKPDIRAVIHAGVPDSLEAYFQEVGRAGRDGLAAACTMVLVPGLDLRLRRHLLEREDINDFALDSVLGRIRELARQGGGILSHGGGDGALALLVASHLQEMGRVELLGHTPGGLELLVPRHVGEPTLAEVRRRLRAQYRRRIERFAQMRSYVFLAQGCRREFLLRYFGEVPPARPAACCSACQPRPLPAGLALAAPRSARGDRLVPAAPDQPEAPPAAAVAPEVAAALLARLKAWRRAKAVQIGMPPYIVFGDRDLGGIAAAAPCSLTDLARCRGIGPAKLQLYGPDLLAEIAAGLAEPPPVAKPGPE